MPKPQTQHLPPDLTAAILRHHLNSTLAMASRQVIAQGIAIWPHGIFRFLHTESTDHYFAEDDWLDFRCEMTDNYETTYNWPEYVHETIHVGGGCPFYYLPNVVWTYKRYVPDGEHSWYPSDHLALPAGPSAGPQEDWPKSTDAKYIRKLPPKPKPVTLIRSGYTYWVIAVNQNG